MSASFFWTRTVNQSNGLPVREKEEEVGKNSCAGDSAGTEHPLSVGYVILQLLEEWHLVNSTCISIT